jgi:hypothetical protein
MMNETTDWEQRAAFIASCKAPKPPRKVVYEEPKPKLNRRCKQCESPMEEPLEEDGSLWMFCSSGCKRMWEQSSRYNKQAHKDAEMS